MKDSASGNENAWAAHAVRLLVADARPTPLATLPVPVGADRRVRIRVKDESAQPTGSIKHRLVRALLVAAVRRGELRRGGTVVVATGGAVAVAGAYFARVIGVGFVALMPRRTPCSLRERVQAYGGRVLDATAPPAGVQDEARQLARTVDGFFLDHFTPGAAATLADCPAPTLADELLPRTRPPAWVVVGAATGVTSALIGRRILDDALPTRLAVVDSEHSAYFPAWVSDVDDFMTGLPSHIPGLGRPRTEPEFRPDVIDLVIPVPDAASIAGMQWLNAHAGLAVGPAAGAGLWGACHLATRLRESGGRGTVVMVAGDGLAAYRGTYDDGEWLAGRGLDPEPHLSVLERYYEGGAWEWPRRSARAG
ncbi:pyridoxal-phosphate dependent enzyme [Streptomyces sp. NPDC059009]|uniref:pyridoxal-phosphate dependent enzyme n=1 Tax=Streptomyces sp. NPDC059009 TaxID=3346694 RepID=UPI003683164C